MIELLEQNKYLFLFIGMLIGGETIFLPAVYLAYIGKLDLIPTFGISVLGSFISDSFWYFVGRMVPPNDWLKKRYFRRKELIDKISRMFESNVAYFLILSKFFYGTRTAVQIISGVKKISYQYYAYMNLIGIIIYLMVIAALVYLAGEGAEALGSNVHKIQIIITIPAALLILIHIWIKRLLKKK